MLFVGHFRYTNPGNGGEFGSFSVIADAENPELAKENFWQRIKENELISENAAVELTGVIEMPADLSKGLVMNHTAFPGDFDISTLHLMPEGPHQKGQVVEAGWQAAECDIPEAAAGNMKVEEIPLDDIEAGEALTPLLQDNVSALWYICWPDGSISIAAADSVEQASHLFDCIGPVCPEMIKPWKAPEMLLDFQFDITSGEWITQSYIDTGWEALMKNLAPQLYYAIHNLQKMDDSEFSNPQISDAGQKVMQRALEEHASEAKKEYEMLGAVHRARCEKEMCMFCIDEAINGKNTDKAGLA